MAKYPSKGESVWNDTASSTRHSYPALKTDFTIDVAIIGAGIAGLTLAYLLKKRGKNVAVFEKYAIGEGVSGFTTSKVTSQHGVIYSELVESFDVETARIYGEANQQAIKTIEEIIKKENIDCGWRREDNYVYTQKDDEIEKLKYEAEVAKSIGLPAEFLTHTPLPFPVKAAVRFRKQGIFHILKYLQALARLVDGGGSHVFEQTHAVKLSDGTPTTFYTKHGKVFANDIVLATNIPAPLKDHAYYSALAYPTRSYIVAGEVDARLVKKGMYINTGDPTHSILPTEIDGKHWLLVGGYGHFAGMSGPSSGRYKKLEELATGLGVPKVTHRWSTWDYTAYDGLPLIGKLYENSEHLYTATGFRKWGMTNATVAALILADQLTSAPNPWAETFRPYRPSAMKSMPEGLVKGVGFNK